MNSLINSCKKTTELIDKKESISLSVVEEMQLKMHKIVCKTCNSYERNSRFLDQAIANMFNVENSHEHIQLSEIKKYEIIEKIENFNNN